MFGFTGVKRFIRVWVLSIYTGGSGDMTHAQSISKFGPKSLINKWIPVLIKTNTDIILYPKDKTKTGLMIAYPHAVYAIPARLRFIVHPALVEEIKWYTYNLLKLKNVEAIARLRIMMTKMPLTKKTQQTEVLNIELLPPVKETKPKYNLWILKFVEKSTIRVRSYDIYEIVEELKKYRIWETSNSSRTGAHWIRYVVLVTPITIEKIRVRRDYLTTLGNLHLYEYEDGKIVREQHYPRER